MFEAKLVPIGKITVDDVKIREARTDTAEYERLEVSIKAKGVQVPIILRSLDDDLILVDGCQRWHICKENGIDDIPARILTDCGENEAMALQMTLNRCRVPQKKTEELECVKTFMMHNPLMSQVNIATFFDMAQADLCNLLNLERLTPEAMELLTNGDICPTNAIALSRIPQDRQNEYLDDATSMKTNEFINHSRTEIKKIRAETRGESTEGIVTLTLRKKVWFEERLESLNHSLETTSPEDDDYLQIAGALNFCKQSLQIDDQSLKDIEQKKKEKREQSKADRKNVPAKEHQETLDYAKELEDRLAALETA